jgi:hypothetical protein
LRYQILLLLLHMAIRERSRIQNNKTMIKNKTAKYEKTSTTIKLFATTSEQKRENIALALLTGSYNPLRKHSLSGQPIDEERLKKFQEEFNNIIAKVSYEMNIDIEGVEAF